MRAEEYLNKFYYRHEHQKEDSVNIQLKNIARLMESYHQHKVNEISDEEIEKESTNNSIYLSSPTQIWQIGAKWLKQRLLNKE